MRKNCTGLISFLSGITNVMFGSGGGILAVESLKKQGLNQKKAQATALSATLLMSLFSAGYYLYNDYFDFTDALMYVPFGIPGALTGSCLLGKFSDRFLKKIFAIFIIWAGLRLIFK